MSAPLFLMLDLFDDSTRPGGGGQSEPCSEEDSAPEPACPRLQSVGVMGVWPDIPPFRTVIPISTVGP